MSAISWRTAAASRTSRTKPSASALSLVFRNCSTVAAMASAFVSATATAAPSAANLPATARPIPPAPPVTTTVRPLNLADVSAMLTTRGRQVHRREIGCCHGECHRGERVGGGGPMRIAVIGGGPGGLYFAALAQQLATHRNGEAHEITVWERNASDDTFGFGVVFSDETLGGIEHADRSIYEAMETEFARWDDIDVHYRDEVITSGGHGFAAMSRVRLLDILRGRATHLGVRVHMLAEAPPADELASGYDLVVAADGVNSATRAKFADTFRPTLDARRCHYMWLGTDLVFDAFKFYVVQTPWGVMQIHGYPYDRPRSGEDELVPLSTFIVEMHERVWRAAGFDQLAARDLAPGESDLASIVRCEELFADILSGHRLI